MARDFMQTAKRIMSSYVTSGESMDSGHVRQDAGEKMSHAWACNAEKVIEACLKHSGDANNSSMCRAGSEGQPTWSKIGGLRETKKEILAVLRSPVMLWKLYRDCPVRLPKGILLYGPPGCGKTCLAKATAEKCGLHMLSVAGPELLGKYIGSSEKAVRDLFAKAHDSGKPTLIFFDEFEALAPRRGTDNAGVTDRVVNQLLTFLDGVEEQPGKKKKKVHHEGGPVEDDDERDGEEESRCRVFIIAATSRPDLIDKALLRPGRVEKHLYCGQPSEIERGDILLRNLRSFPCGPASSDNNVTVEKDEEALGGDESLEEVVAWVCKQDKAAACVSADFSALANSAFLEATSEVTHTADDSNGIKAIIRARHVRAAFETLRPSLSTKDLSFYQRIHDKFGGEHTLVSNATASSRPLARAPARPHEVRPKRF